MLREKKVRLLTNLYIPQVGRHGPILTPMELDEITIKQFENMGIKIEYVEVPISVSATYPKDVSSAESSVPEVVVSEPEILTEVVDVVAVESSEIVEEEKPVRKAGRPAKK